VPPAGGCAVTAIIGSALKSNRIDVVLIGEELGF
jgi:hypothetical protein